MIFFEQKLRAMNDECKYCALGTAFVRKMAPFHAKLLRKILLFKTAPFETTSICTSVLEQTNTYRFHITHYDAI